MSDFSYRLKQLRTNHGLTQKQLASALNVSQNAVFNWENDKRKPNYEMMQKIADYFNVSVGYILGYENDGIEIPDRNIGNRILDVLNSKHITIETLSKKTNIDLASLKQICSIDNSYVNIDLLSMISIALNIDITEFLDINDSEPLDYALAILSFDVHKYGQLKTLYDQLNDEGKKEAIKRIEELTLIEKYSRPIECIEED